MSLQSPCQTPWNTTTPGTPSTDSDNTLVSQQTLRSTCSKQRVPFTSFGAHYVITFFSSALFSLLIYASLHLLYHLKKYLFFDSTAWLVGFLVPWPGMEPRPWEHRVPSTRPQGKSPLYLLSLLEIHYPQQGRAYITFLKVQFAKHPQVHFLF